MSKVKSKATKKSKVKRSRSRSTKTRPKKDDKKSDKKLVKTLTDNALAVQKCSAEKLTVGSCIERLTHYYITSVGPGYVGIMNEDGEKWSLSARICRNEFIAPSDEQVNQTEERSHTALAEIMKKPGLK
jgi:hypothetical protein